MTVDEIALTLPADEAFTRVVHLVLGGLAVRLDLTVEVLEDLELGLDTLLERFETAAADEVTVRIRIGDGELHTLVGPFTADIRKEVEHETDDLDLRRILRAVAERVEVTDGDGGQWVELTKRVSGSREAVS